MKVMTVVGTRPELIRLSRVIPALDEVFDHVLVHTGQNYDYELNEVFFQDLKIRKPDVFLNAAGETLGSTLGSILASSYEVMNSHQPNAVLILGDTNSSLSAIIAKRLKIPVFHMEAGNRCFNLNVPEEINRQIVDKIADINLTYSKIAREYLISEGFAADRVIVTGSPIREVVQYYRDETDNSKILETLGLKQHEYFVLSLHREENVDADDRLRTVLRSVASLARNHKKKVVFSVHPRTQSKIMKLDNISLSDFLLRKPFGYFDYLTLQMKSFCTISDSGTISEEANILGFKAVNLREEHERPEAFESAAVPFSGLRSDDLNRAVEVALRNGDKWTSASVADYEVEVVSEKIVTIISSYTAYVNKVVWGKNFS